MNEQQSQKRGVKSDAQKIERAREGYETIPPSQPVAGAFGVHKKRDTPTDQELGLLLDERARKEEK